MIKLRKIFILIITALTICCTAPCKAHPTIQDELVESTLKNKPLQNPYKPYKYNYEDLKVVPIELRVMVNIKSENDIEEGEKIVFLACHDVYEKGHKILEKNELVYATVETIISSGMNGIPASIIFGDFKFNNIDSSKVTDTYEVYGQDRSLWVYPLKWALTFLPPTGSLTNFIKGGHAKLKDRDIIVLYYHPNW